MKKTKVDQQGNILEERQEEDWETDGQNDRQEKDGGRRRVKEAEATGRKRL